MKLPCRSSPLASPAPQPVLETDIAAADITGTSDVVVMRSSPDLALALESASAGRATPAGGVDHRNVDEMNEQARNNPAAAIALAAGAGLLFGIVIKKTRA